MKRYMLFAALAAIPLVSVAADPAPDASSNAAATAAARKVSPERIAQMRAKLIAQVAAYDAAEQAMRTPTAQESASLALSSGNSTSTAVRLPNGGMAVSGDVANASFLTAVRGEDGKIKIDHKNVAKGGTHAR